MMDEFYEGVIKTNEIYGRFYHHVSLTQDIEKRLDSFKNYKSYHYKDLFYIKKNLKDATVVDILDVGCCGTPYPKLFDLSAVNYNGVDISEHSLDRMNQYYNDPRIKWVLDDILSLDTFPDESLDLILATQVFEHLIDPERALFSCLSKLRKGGKIMIGTEAALFIQNGEKYGFFSKILLGLSQYLGSLFSIYGLEPLCYPHHEIHQFNDGDVNRKIRIPHGHFHPLYFSHIITTRNWPAKITFRRITGGTVFDALALLLGEKAYYFWQEIKARIPLLRELGNQIFVVVEKK